MYRIDENKWKEKNIVLIPAMLDAHFPLLQYAFYSRRYHPVVLENEENVTNLGLQYVNNDMCYPSILNIGQMIGALQSGKYDLNRTGLLMPTAGDACRGSNYAPVLKRAIGNAGFPQVGIYALNLKGIDKEHQLKLNFDMVWRALFGLFYGDLLMLLINQTRPYELEKGSAQALWQKWVDVLADDMKRGRHLTLGCMKKNFDRICADFAALPKTGEKKQRVGIVGEVYIKYCHMGNWNMIHFLEKNGCESHTNGLSWYAMYYMYSHMMDPEMKDVPPFERKLYQIGLRFFARLQDAMIASLKGHGFYTMERFDTVRQEAEGLVSTDLKVGDGWLIGAEIVGHIKHDCPKVLAVQPFGCMPNHCCGRGLYPSLQRKLPEGRIASVDMDSGGSPANVYNRVRMLIDF